MPNALSIFDSETQLGPVDFEMGLDVEEQARISEHSRLSFDVTPERNGLSFEIYEDPEETGDVGGIYHPTPLAEAGDSINQAYHPHHTLMDGQFTFPPRPDDGNYHSEPERQTQGHAHANSPKYQSDDYYCGDGNQTQDEDEGEDKDEDKDQENIQNPSVSPSSTSTIRQTQNQTHAQDEAEAGAEAQAQAGFHYSNGSSSSRAHAHRRSDSEESYTTHWDYNGTYPTSSLATFRTRVHYKSPYLGPVGWTVPSRYTSITRHRVEAERSEARTRTEAERERELTPLTRLRMAALAGMDTEEVDDDDDGYAGDIDSRSDHDHDHEDEDEHELGHGNGNGSLRTSARSRVVCRRCESKPFLIYQDPEWIDVRGVDVDPFVNAAASDDKENVDPNGRGNVDVDVDGDGDVVVGVDEDDGDGDVEMGG